MDHDDDQSSLVAARDALRESRDRLRLALSVGRMGDWSWDPATNVVTLGPTAAGILGLPAGTLTTTQAELHRQIHEDDLARAVAASQDALKARVDYQLEYRIRRPSGELIWISSSGGGTYSTDGELIGHIGLIQDITARKHIEEALQDESRVLELLNQTGASIASRLDLQSLVQSVTDAATELSGAKFGAFFYNVKNATGESFLLFALCGAPREDFEKLGLPRNTPLFDPTFRGERVVRSDDITKDPHYGTLGGMPPGHLPVRSYLAVPVLLRSGETIGGLFFGHPDAGVFTERTERIIVGVAAQAGMAIDNARLYEAAQRAAEDRRQLLESERSVRTQLERMAELKDEFLASLSHELRTPLSAILGWVQVVRRRSVSGIELTNAMEIIERNARIQARLIDDLLDMSRITSGQIRLEVQRLEPASFIEAAIETARPAAAAKGVRVETLLDRDAGLISGDPGRMQQVLWNLLSNAIKFTPRGGVVQVLLHRLTAHVEITVADTGIGIKPEFLLHLFERFRQADASSTRQFGGLGLGLSIVKHLVELHGGTVVARSRGENTGSSFTVTLPLRAVSGRGEDPPDSTDYRATNLAGLKVLVVDDEPDARNLIRHVLTDCGAEVSTAANGPEALELIEQVSHDLLISDVGMHGMDGYALLQRVRSLDEPRRRIPAIALTAFARLEDRNRALRAGFSVHVAKPVEPAELVATVASMARRGPG